MKAITVKLSPKAIEKIKARKAKERKKPPTVQERYERFKQRVKATIEAKKAPSQPEDKEFVGPPAPRPRPPTTRERFETFRKRAVSTIEEKTGKKIKDTYPYEDRRPTYSKALTEISLAQTSIKESRDLLRDPRTYYDPFRNVIVYADPMTAAKPIHAVHTATKISDLDKALSTLMISEYDVKKFQREGYQIGEGEEGGYKFFKTPKQIEQELISAKVEELQAARKGTLEQRLAGVGTWISSAFLGDITRDPMGLKSSVQVLTGDIKGGLKTKARELVNLDRAYEEGISSYILKVGTGSLATVGFAFGAGSLASMGAKAATGYLGAKGVYHAANIVKAVELTAGLGFGGLAGKDVIETYQKEGAEDAITKAAAYAILFGAAYKGYKSVDSGKWIAKGEGRYFKKHPDALRMSWGVEGEKVITVGQIKGFTSRGTPTESTKLSLSDLIMWKQGSGQRQLFIRFPGSGDSTFGPGLKGIGAVKGDTRGFRVDTAIAKSEHGMLLETEGAIRTTPLMKGESLSYVAGKSPQMGKHIFTFRRLDFETAKMLTAKEGGTLGGYTQTMQKTVPMSVLNFAPETIPIFSGVSPWPTVPIILPVLQQELDTPETLKITGEGELDTIPVFELDTVQRKRTVPVHATTPKFDVGLVDDDVQIQKQFMALDVVEEPVVKTALELDFAPDIPVDIGEKVWFKQNVPGFPPFLLPKHMGGSGGTDEGFGFLDPFARKRKHKVKNILEELEDFGGLSL